MYVFMYVASYCNQLYELFCFSYSYVTRYMTSYVLVVAQHAGERNNLSLVKEIVYPWLTSYIASSLAILYHRGGYY